MLIASVLISTGDRLAHADVDDAVGENTEAVSLVGDAGLFFRSGYKYSSSAEDDTKRSWVPVAVAADDGLVGEVIEAHGLASDVEATVELTVFTEVDAVVLVGDFG